MSMFSRTLGREQERLLRHEPDLGAEVAVVDEADGDASISMRPLCGA
jgi:hypothetical protein